jgi:hypothetical protein
MQTHKVNAQGFEFTQGVHQLPQASRKSIITVYKHRIELSASGIRE